MKKRFGLLICLFLVWIVPGAWAGMPYNIGANKAEIMANKTTPIYTASARVLTGKAVYYGILIKLDGTNNLTLNIYDDGGHYLVPNNTVIKGTDYVKAISFPGGIGIDGLVVNVSVAGGGTCSYQVVYDQ